MLNAHAYCSIHIIGASGSLILIDGSCDGGVLVKYLFVHWYGMVSLIIIALHWCVLLSIQVANDVRVSWKGLGAWAWYLRRRRQLSNGAVVL